MEDVQPITFGHPTDKPIVKCLGQPVDRRQVGQASARSPANRPHEARRVCRWEAAVPDDPIAHPSPKKTSLMAKHTIIREFE